MHAYVCRNGSDARGYFVWSFLDVFEFIFAYRMRFGLCGVDMNAGARTRYVRSSARWYGGFLRGGELRPPLPTTSGRTPRDVIRPPSSDDGDSTCIVVIVARTPRAGTVGNNLEGV